MSILLQKLQVIVFQHTDRAWHILMLSPDDLNVWVKFEILVLQVRDFGGKFVDARLIGFHTHLHFHEASAHHVKVVCKLSYSLTGLGRILQILGGALVQDRNLWVIKGLVLDGDALVLDGATLVLDGDTLVWICANWSNLSALVKRLLLPWKIIVSWDFLRSRRLSA